jgi:TolA-binding protein
MTELHNHPINRISCDHVMTIWDKEVSGSLPKSMEQALTGHLSQCPECSDFVNLASNLFRLPVTLSEDELNAAIQSVIRKARKERSARIAGIPRRWAITAAAIAALAIISVFGVYVLSPDTMYEEPEALQCSPSIPTALATGVLMSLCDGTSPPVNMANREEPAEAGNRDVRISLQAGTVGLLVDPHRPNKRRVTVSTPLGDVRVKGTLFTVRVDDENAWVEVFRGIVEVTPFAGDADPYEVPSGYGAELVSGRVYSLSISAAHADTLRQILLKSKSDNSGKGDISGETEPAASMADTATDVDTSDIDNAADSADATSAQARTPRPHKKNDDRLHAILQSAQSCLIDQDWECARTNYRQILSRHSNRPESLPVLISLAKIELRHLGAPNDALTHYSSYQRRAPNGPLAEEALLGIAESHRRLGNADRESDSLRKFILQYPGSAHIKKVRGRLKQLEQRQLRNAKSATSG